MRHALLEVMTNLNLGASHVPRGRSLGWGARPPALQSPTEEVAGIKLARWANLGKYMHAESYEPLSPVFSIKHAPPVRSS